MSLYQKYNFFINVQIGNIDPYALTGEDEEGNPTGQATVTYNMGGDVGLAAIIATATKPKIIFICNYWRRIHITYSPKRHSQL